MTFPPAWADKGVTLMVRQKTDSTESGVYYMRPTTASFDPRSRWRTDSPGHFTVRTMEFLKEWVQYVDNAKINPNTDDSEVKYIMVVPRVAEDVEWQQPGRRSSGTLKKINSSGPRII